MLKLLKYEWKACARACLPLYGAIILVALINHLLYSEAVPELLFGIPAAIMSMLYVVIFAAVFVATAVILVQRFYKSLLGGEGYLMFTLPVSRSQLIWSKLLVALVWSVLSTVLAALAWMAEISVVGRENVFSLIAQGLRSLRQHLSGNLTGCAAALVVLCLVSCLVSFL